jgi:hypothetical protein
LTVIWTMTRISRRPAFSGEEIMVDREVIRWFHTRNDVSCCATFIKRSDWSAGDLQKNHTRNSQITLQFNSVFIDAYQLSSALFWVPMSVENLGTVIGRDGWMLCFSGPTVERIKFGRRQSDVSRLHPWIDHFIRHEMKNEWMIHKTMFRRFL